MARSNNDYFAIIIGETGTGKSTFINYVANTFSKKPSLDVLQVIIPNEHHRNSIRPTVKHSERALDDSTLSKTTKCQFYRFSLSPDQGCLVLIDTPGLGDTSGYLKDNENVNMIFKTIKLLEYISAIILVMNGTTTRMTSNISNVLTRFRQFFPNSIYTNIIVVLTNCEGYNVSFDKSSLNLPSTCRFFCMQNTAYCKPPNQIKAHRASFEKEFNESIKTTHEVIKHILQLQPQLTKAFTDLDDKRYRLQAFLHEAYLMILEMEKLENELESLKIVAGLEKTNVERLLQTSQISVLRAISTDYNNTVCMQCNQVCHKHCKLNETALEGNSSTSTCSKMRNGRCIQCSCPTEGHYYGSKDLKKVNQSILDSINQAKQQLRYEEEDHALTISRLNSVETIKTEIQELLNRQCNQIRQTCIDLKKSCSNMNIAQELINFVQILNQGRQQLQSPLVLNRLDYLIDELQRIVSDYGQIEETDGDTYLCPTTQIENSADAPPPLPPRKISKQETSINTPRYYQPNLESEVNSSLKPSQHLSMQPQRYSAYSTEKLIGAHQELMRMNSEYAKRTLHELQQRAKGVSVGILNRYELVQFASHYADFRHHDKNDLQEEYDTLAKKIDTDMNHDASNLEHVEPDDLLKIAALSFLLTQ